MRGTLLKHWPLLIITPLFLGAVVLSLLKPHTIGRWQDVVESVSIVVGWLLVVVQYLHNRSEKFYLFANSLRLWLTNVPTYWNFTITLRGCTANEPLDSVWRAIKNENPRAVRWHFDAAKVIANLPGYSLRVFSAPGDPDDNGRLDSTADICIQVSDLALPFREFRGRIENEAIPLLKRIVELLQPQTGKYAAKVTFSSVNPYFGFFVRRLDLPSVMAFACDLIDTSYGNQKETVTVRKDRIEIVTDDLPALLALSSKYVRLATV